MWPTYGLHSSVKILRPIQTGSFSRYGWSIACLKNGQATVVKKYRFSNGKRKILETKNFWSLAHSTVMCSPLTTHKDVLLLILAATCYSVAFWDKQFFVWDVDMSAFRCHPRYKPPPLLFSDWISLLLDMMELFSGKNFSDADHSTWGFCSLGLLRVFLDDLFISWGLMEHRISE